MSETTDTMIAAAKTASTDQVAKIVTGAKASFLEMFRGFFSKEDLDVVDELFTKAALAKAKQFTAATTDDAEEAVEEYETYMETIETIGDQYYVVGKAKAGVLVRSIAHQIISGFFAVAGAVIQAGLGIVIPGVGSLVGAGLNAGLQHVVAYFQGD